MLNMHSYSNAYSNRAGLACLVTAPHEGDAFNKRQDYVARLQKRNMSASWGKNLPTLWKPTVSLTVKTAHER